MDGMPRIAPPFLVLAVLASGGCGSDVAPDHSAPGEFVGFPVTIERSGGVAGFQDKVVVEDDGDVTVSTRSATFTCRVDEQTLEPLAALARSATGTSTATASHPDALTVLVRGSKGVTVLQEGDLPNTAPVVGRILADIGRPAEGRSVCR